MSGTSDMSADSGDVDIDFIYNVLNRGTHLEALAFLHDALGTAGQAITPAMDRVAIGFDANAIFRIGSRKAGDDIIDYLRAKHEGPIIVPGQALQEVWNNQLTVFTPLGKSLHTKMAELEAEAAKIDHRFGTQGDAVRQSIDNLATEFNEIFDAKTLESFRKTLQLFLEVAEVSYVPRSDFREIAVVRHETKSPPGFKDAGHGDFFIWADFLYGLRRKKDQEIDAIVLVTEDQKPDWSRSGIAHPVLSAEVAAVRPRPFELWTIAKLAEYVEGRP
jgi:hypothetical protein